MADFRTLSETMLASPQITADDIAQAKVANVTMVINNRPDGEDPGAPQGEEIEAAAAQAGIRYRAIPIGHSGFSENQVDEMIKALDEADGGRVLGYCRSGTRTTLLWSLAQAKMGADPDDIAAAARAAGYDVSPVRPMLDMLASR